MFPLDSFEWEACSCSLSCLVMVNKQYMLHRYTMLHPWNAKFDKDPFTWSLPEAQYINLMHRVPRIFNLFQFIYIINYCQCESICREYDGVWSSNPGALKNQGSHRNGIEVYGHDASALIATWHGSVGNTAGSRRLSSNPLASRIHLDSFGIIPR